jgi:hypothetical protein
MSNKSVQGLGLLAKSVYIDEAIASISRALKHLDNATYELEMADEYNYSIQATAKSLELTKRQLKTKYTELTGEEHE